jgi:fucose permease
MSTREPDPGRTDDTVRARYRAWADANPRPRGPTAIGMPEVSEGAVRMAGTAAGILIGLGLLALAATAFAASRSWGTIDRGGAVVAYFLTGAFLTIAGVGCIWATLNHNFGVLARTPEHH